MNKPYDLDKDEQELLDAIEDGEFKSVKNLAKEKQRYQGYAKAMLEKSRSINIRLTEGDYLDIKAIAVREGMPYQTLISSVIHKYISKN